MDQILTKYNKINEFKFKWNTISLKEPWTTMKHVKKYFYFYFYFYFKKYNFFLLFSIFIINNIEEERKKQKKKNYFLTTELINGKVFFTSEIINRKKFEWMRIKWKWNEKGLKTKNRSKSFPRIEQNKTKNFS